jgi:phage-related protein
MAEGPNVGKVSVKVTPDTSRFHRLLKKQLERGKDILRVDVDLDTKGVKAQFEKLVSSLGTAKVRWEWDNSNARVPALPGNQRVKIGVDVDQVRQLEERLKGLGKSDHDIAATAASIASLGAAASNARGGVGGLGRAGLITFAVFALAAPAVGLVAGLIAGLPSLLAATGAGIGAVALGMDGIKKAAATLQPQFDALKASVSGVFESRLTEQFQQLSVLFPILEQGMGRVAGGLMDMMQGFTNVVTSGQGMAQIQGILANTSFMFSMMAPMVEKFTSSFLTLASSGAASFNLLLQPLQNFATGFNDMANRITSNGMFEGAMAGLSQTLDGILNLFNRLMEVGVTAMAALGGPLQNMLGGFGDLLVGAMPALTSFSSVLNAIMPIITQLATTLGGALSSAVVALAPPLTEMVNVLGPVLTTALQSLAPLLGVIAENLGGLLLSAVQALAPIMPQIAETFAMLATAISGTLAQVLPVLVQAFAQLLPVFIELIPPILQVVQAFVPLIPALGQLVVAALGVVSALTPLIAGFAAVVTVVALVIAKIVEFATNVVAWVVNAAAGIVSAITSGMQQFVSVIGDGIGAAVDWFTGLGDKVRAACAGFGTVLIAAGKALMKGLLDGITAGWNAVKDFVGGLASKIASLKGPIPYDKKVLIPNGEALMEGLTKGIKDGSESALDEAKSLAGKIRDAFAEGMGSGVDVDLALKDKIKDLKANRDLMNLQLDQTRSSGATDETKMLNEQKQQLNLQIRQLEFAKRYGEEVSSTTDKQADYNSQLESAMKIPHDFADATTGQFMGDLGISGNGALTSLAKQGLQWGSQFVFNVSDVDSALGAKDRITNQQSLQMAGR